MPQVWGQCVSMPAVFHPLRPFLIQLATSPVPKWPYTLQGYHPYPSPNHDQIYLRYKTQAMVLNSSNNEAQVSRLVTLWDLLWGGQPAPTMPHKPRLVPPAQDVASQSSLMNRPVWESLPAWCLFQHFYLANIALSSNDYQWGFPPSIPEGTIPVLVDSRYSTWEGGCWQIFTAWVRHMLHLIDFCSNMRFSFEPQFALPFTGASVVAYIP